MAAIDLRSATLHLSQYIESSQVYHNTATLLQIFKPDVVIFPSNATAAHSASGMGLIGLLEKEAAKKIVLARGCFDDTKGSFLLQDLASQETLQQTMDSHQKEYYLSLAAAAALFKWLDSDKGVMVTHHSLQITYNGSFDHMHIDANSIRNLEIVESLAPIAMGRKVERTGSLFGTLKATKTAGGTRLLRANLLQPLKDMNTITSRLDCMDELTSNEDIFFGLCQILSMLHKDSDRILSHLVYKPARVHEQDLDGARTRRNEALVASIISLKETMDLLPRLAEVLEPAKSMLLHNIRRNVCLQPTLEAVKDKIAQVVEADVLHARAPFVARTQQCFAVKAGIDGFLDLARKIFCETSEGKFSNHNCERLCTATPAIHELGRHYRETFDLPSLKMPFNSRRGFYISIPVKEFKKLQRPSLFVSKHGKSIQCSTPDLTSLNLRNKEAAAECYVRSERCLEGLCVELRKSLPWLALLSESLCFLDMMVNAFAFLVSSNPSKEFVRPEFTTNGPLAIEGGRHPVLEKLLEDEYVPNNTFLSEASNMMIITGPNMSGKSTYLRQVAVITILAHVGCHVPARFASFQIVDRLFTRIGSSDSLESNSSTFMAEMRETAYLINNLTSRSLILIDELGKATSSADGFALAWSCSEYLMSLGAYTILTTHMQRMAEMSSIYPNVKVCYFSVDIVDGRLEYKASQVDTSLQWQIISKLQLAQAYGSAHWLRAFHLSKLSCQMPQFLLKEGQTNIPHYGLHLAEIVGFPPAVRSDARRIAKVLDDVESKRLHRGRNLYLELHKTYGVAQKLLCLKHANLAEADMRRYLQSLKNLYLE
eukprot:SM000059S18671  [mRNA]  locus=s59:346470:352381:+ [translate_table: standard]